MPKVLSRSEFILILSCFLVFGIVIQFQFLSWDDPTHIYSNPLFNPPTLESLSRFWLQPYYNFYIPVTYSVWWFLVWLTQFLQLTPPSSYSLSPLLFHLTNLLIHITNTILVHRLVLSFLEKFDDELLCKQKDKILGLEAKNWAALFGALLFAIHPIQSQILGWVATLRDLLSTLFGLLCLQEWFSCLKSKPYLRKKSQELGPSGWGLTRSTLFFGLALLSKPSAVAILPMLIVLNLFFFRIPWQCFVKKIVVWFIFSALLIGLTKSYQPDGVGLELNWTPYFFRPIVALDALSFYLFKLLWPFRMTFDYGRGPVSLMEGWTCYLSASFSGLILALFYRFRKKIPGIWTSVLFWIAGLTPTLGLIPFDFQKFSTVSDHYVYFSLLGLSTALAIALKNKINLKSIGMCSFIFLLLGFRAHSQVHYWQNNLILFSHSVEMNEDSFSAQLHLGNALYNEKNYDSALVHLKKALSLKPVGYVATNIAVVYISMNSIDQATTYLHKAMELNPYDNQTYLLMGEMLFKSGKKVEAIPYFEKVIELEPKLYAPYTFLSQIYEDLGNYPKALNYLQVSAELSPGDSRIRAKTNSIQSMINDTSYIQARKSHDAN